jgi:methylmalonyl-CoA/ethylmalonyl-CoA epimerase
VGGLRVQRRQRGGFPRIRSAGRALLAPCRRHVGHVQWELIDPLDEESVYARFLAEKGAGVHHVAAATSNFEETVAQADRGNGVILSGEFGGAKVAYLGTDRDLG